MVGLEDVFFTGYDGNIKIDADILIISAWNEYVKYEGKGGEKIYFNNDKAFFENTFECKYDAVWAASLGEKWDRTDRFVFFNFNRRLTSFNRWNDEKSPINIDKIDVGSLININKINKKRKDLS